MKILILASSRHAPTYNDNLIRQVQYINSFENMEAELYNDLPLYKIEEKILSCSYDCVFPYTVFDYSREELFPFTFNTALYNILLYHNQNYIGSDVYTHMLLNDKALTGHRSDMGLPSFIVTRVLWENQRQTIHNMLINNEIGWPLIIKPNTLCASMGITSESIVYTAEDAFLVIESRFQQFPDLTELLAEKYLYEADEYTVSITGNNLNVITCVTAMVPTEGKHTLYSFESKNMPMEKRQMKYQAVGDSLLKERLKNCAKKLAVLFNIRDFGRFDFLVEQDKIYLIDANTIPSLGRNYMHEYTANGTIHPEQILALLVYAFSLRTHEILPQSFINALPAQFLQLLKD